MRDTLPTPTMPSGRAMCSECPHRFNVCLGRVGPITINGREPEPGELHRCHMAALRPCRGHQIQAGRDVTADADTIQITDEAMP